MAARRTRASSSGDTRASRDLQKLVNDLDKYADGNTVKRLLRRELKQTSDGVTPAIRSAIRRIPSKNQNAKLGRKSLRARLSAATQTRIRTGKTSVAITAAVSPGKMPPGQGSLPAYMEGTLSPWRRPLFGDWNHPQQQSAHPFFFGAVGPFRLHIQKDVIKVADQIAKDLES